MADLPLIQLKLILLGCQRTGRARVGLIHLSDHCSYTHTAAGVKYTSFAF